MITPFSSESHEKGRRGESGGLGAIVSLISGHPGVRVEESLMDASCLSCHFRNHALVQFLPSLVSPSFPFSVLPSLLYFLPEISSSLFLVPGIMMLLGDSEAHEILHPALTLFIALTLLNILFIYMFLS